VDGVLIKNPHNFTKEHKLLDKGAQPTSQQHFKLKVHFRALILLELKMKKNWRIITMMKVDTNIKR
jgi:hypothetical protein